MGFFRKVKSVFHDDWCSQCSTEMEVQRRQLFALPTMTVGHYVSHKEAEYYKKNLVPVAVKAEVPTGMYACGLTAYRCPECGHRAIKASVFLPVRGEEKVEENLYFEQGELEDFLWNTADPKAERELLRRDDGRLAADRVMDTSQYGSR